MTRISSCTLSHAVQYLVWSPGEGHAFIMMENATIKTAKEFRSATKQRENEVYCFAHSRHSENIWYIDMFYSLPDCLISYIFT